MKIFRIPQKTRRGLVARDTSAMADGLPVALAVSTAVPVPPPDAPLSQPLLPDRDDGPPGEEQIQQLRAQGFTEGKEPRRLENQQCRRALQLELPALDAPYALWFTF